MFNDFQQGPLIGAFIFGTITGQAFSFILIVRLSDADVIFYATLAQLMIGCIMGSLVTLTLMAMIHNNSCSILEYMAKRHVSYITKQEAK